MAYSGERLPAGLERKLVMKVDLDNTFLWGPFSIGTTVALLTGNYKVPEVGDLKLPDEPLKEKGLKGKIHWGAENFWHFLRFPKKAAVKALSETRNVAEQYGREIQIDVSSGRKPFLHALTYWRLKGYYPPEGQQWNGELFNEVHLNPGVKSPRFKGGDSCQAITMGHIVINVEDDPQAAETEAGVNALVFLSVSRLNLPAKIWVARHRDNMPPNIIPFRNFKEIPLEIAARLEDGRL